MRFEPIEVVGGREQQICLTHFVWRALGFFFQHNRLPAAPATVCKWRQTSFRSMYGNCCQQASCLPCTRGQSAIWSATVITEYYSVISLWPSLARLAKCRQLPASHCICALVHAHMKISVPAVVHACVYSLAAL